MNKIAVIVITLLCLSCGKEEGSKTLKLAHGLDVNHSVHKAMVLLGEDLVERSGGKLKLEIYPSQQLGSERQCVELLQVGSLDMTKVSVGVLENFSPKLKVFGLPYLFRDREHSFRVLDGPIGKELLTESEKYLLKGIAYYDAGSRSFYTKSKPVHTPQDLEGMKIRVMESITAMDMVKSFGGAATPISWGELYTSLQQGVVDGAENNPPSFYLSRHYEVCKYYSLDEHTALPDVLIIGTKTWDRLTEQEQEWLRASADKSVKIQRKLWMESEKEALEAVQKEGVEIITPDKTLFSDMVGELYESYKENPEMYSLIDRIQNTK
ncbi:TRAP transporter substrate-binding protein [Muricauda sp. CAU 1633]|uniref:TRAP transporter substrate-binding protein n=1 Tax=Allomuricauda sp. CAU 1633 TaxID=2816036 RepID=UPI001A9013A2|nr:TRAP transporter substrate-binding protein [Muricauda sp. CAU 1633]MBO0324101.1 TRAP transporter substrate-binding protein [Muricauda sp. CAU 1633]